MVNLCKTSIFVSITARDKMQSKLAILIITTFITLSTMLRSCSAAPQPTSVCDPAVIDDMPAHIKKVCIALENSSELVNAMRLYLRNEAAGNLKFELFKVNVKTLIIYFCNRYHCTRIVACKRGKTDRCGPCVPSIW